MGQMIDGKSLAKELRSNLKSEVEELKTRGIFPKLTVLLVGENPASEVYVRNKQRAAKRIGIESQLLRYPASATQAEILNKIKELNEDSTNHGILVQLPLPKSFDESAVLLAIDTEKDVDGFHPINVGKLVAGQDCLMPCTPSGVIALIESTGTDITGKNAVIVGRSNIVGKPVAMMLMHKHATVTVCHSRTIDLPGKVADADIVIAAIGRAKFIRGEWIKPGAVVIDVGINHLDDGSLCGDVEYDVALERASHITPVPGGVGPMTIAMLMKNTVTAAQRLAAKE